MAPRSSPRSSQGDRINKYSHLRFYVYSSNLSLSDFSRLWSGCGGERDATPLGWQGANIEGRGIWKVGALRRIRVVVKNGSNTDLITGLRTLFSMM